MRGKGKSEAGSKPVNNPASIQEDKGDLRHPGPRV